MNLSLLNGSAGVKGLVIGNPEGYKTPQAISVGTVAVGVNPLSVLSDKIVVRSVRVESPEITFEGGLGGNNLSKIMDNVNAFTKSGGSAATNTPSGRPQARHGKSKWMTCRSPARWSRQFHGMVGKEMTLPLPDIHLTNLGKDSGGITAADLTQRVLGAITAAPSRPSPAPPPTSAKAPGMWARMPGKRRARASTKSPGELAVCSKNKRIGQFAAAVAGDF